MIGGRRLCARQGMERWRWLGGVSGLFVRRGDVSYLPRFQFRPDMWDGGDRDSEFVAQRL